MVLLYKCIDWVLIMFDKLVSLVGRLLHIDSTLCNLEFDLESYLIYRRRICCLSFLFYICSLLFGVFTGVIITDLLDYIFS